MTDQDPLHREPLRPIVDTSGQLTNPIGLPPLVPLRDDQPMPYTDLQPSTTYLSAGFEYLTDAAGMQLEFEEPSASYHLVTGSGTAPRNIMSEPDAAGLTTDTTVGTLSVLLTLIPPSDKTKEKPLGLHPTPD